MSLARFPGGQVSFLRLTLPIVGAVLIAPFLGLLLADGGKDGRKDESRWLAEGWTEDAAPAATGEGQAPEGEGSAVHPCLC